MLYLEDTTHMRAETPRGSTPLTTLATMHDRCFILSFFNNIVRIREIYVILQLANLPEAWLICKVEREEIRCVCLLCYSLFQMNFVRNRLKSKVG